MLMKENVYAFGRSQTSWHRPWTYEYSKMKRPRGCPRRSTGGFWNCETHRWEASATEGGYEPRHPAESGSYNFYTNQWEAWWTDEETPEVQGTYWDWSRETAANIDHGLHHLESPMGTGHRECGSWISQEHSEELLQAVLHVHQRALYDIFGNPSEQWTQPPINLYDDSYMVWNSTAQKNPNVQHDHPNVQEGDDQPPNVQEGDETDFFSMD